MYRPYKSQVSVRRSTNEIIARQNGRQTTAEMINVVLIDHDGMMHKCSPQPPYTL